MAVAELEIQREQFKLSVRTQELPDVIEFLSDWLAVLWKDWSRSMEVGILDVDRLKFSLSGQCPHCLREAVFMQVTSVHQRRIDDTSVVAVVAMQCQGCLRYILGMVSMVYNRWEYFAHFPIGKPDDSVDASVPAEIAFDFAEALRCVWVKSFKAAIIMCCRALQTSCDGSGAQGLNLYEQIDDLAKKGTITEPLRQWAHTVRLSRNRKAHDKEDDSTINAGEREKRLEQDAAAIVAFTREYFHHVYVMPEKLRAYNAPKALPGAS